MKQKLLFSLSFLILLLVLFVSKDLSAYPKFAALMGDKCQDCHVNPTGGGIRAPWGLKYSQKFLYMKPFEKANKEIVLETQLTKTIQVGGDMRMIFIDDETGEGNPKFNTFFQMQGDLYVNAKLGKHINIVLNPGFDIPNTYAANHLAVKSELYGMVSQLPAGLYIKAGRFIPNFGIKIPEHRSFQRLYNDLYTPYAADQGIEVGIAPSFFTLTASLTNGTSRDINGTLANSFDFDQQKQFTAFADFRWAQKDDKYTFGIGGSFVNNPFNFDPANKVTALRQIGGAFLSIGIMQRVAILAEYDYNRLKINDSTSQKREFNTIFGEIDIRVTNGVELKAQIETFDPELGIKRGSQERRRYSFGAEFYPMTGLEIESIIRIVDEPDPNLNLKNNEFQTTFKFYF